MLNLHLVQAAAEHLRTLCLRKFRAALDNPLFVIAVGILVRLGFPLAVAKVGRDAMSPPELSGNAPVTNAIKPPTKRKLNVKSCKFKEALIFLT